MTDHSSLRKPMERQLSSLPQEIHFCKKCVISNQRPRIVFDEEGVCNACRFAEMKENGAIDWATREEELVALLDQHRRDDGWYDVIVPGSGGKDSSYVAHQLKKRYGMHPLHVTWAPLKYTDIGFRNFQNFVGSGFTNITCSPNGQLRRKLARIGFEEVGDPFLPFIYGQMAFAFHVALRFDVKLIFFGENGEAEYGGDQKNAFRPFMPFEDWATSYFKGTTVDDLVAFGREQGIISSEDYEDADLVMYRPPAVESIERAGVQMHWYSYYHQWIPQENYYYAAEHTHFEANPQRSQGTYSKYASLDDQLDGIHYYMGLIKFGIGRATSDAAHEIREGHLTREEGVALVRKYDAEFPEKHFAESLEYMGINEERFHEVVDGFRQPHIWLKENGEWKLRKQVS